MNHFTPWLDSSSRRPYDLGTFVKLRIEERERRFTLVQCILAFIVTTSLLTSVALKVVL